MSLDLVLDIVLPRGLAWHDVCIKLYRIFLWPKLQKEGETNFKNEHLEIKERPTPKNWITGNVCPSDLALHCTGLADLNH